MLSTLDISASALLAQRVRMDTIAQNLSSARITRGADGKPYQRRFVIFHEGRADNPALPGVHVEIGRDPSTRLELDPGHPDADADGYLHLPNISEVVEAVNAMEASRAYEANVTTMEVTKAMLNSSLRLLA